MSRSGAFGGVSLRARHVWRRDVEVALRTWWTAFLPPILEPVLYLLAFGAGMGSLVGTVAWNGREIGYTTFFAPGLIAISIFFWAFFETLYSSFIRMYYQRTYDAIVATPLSLEDVITGEILWGATKSVFVSAVMLAVISAFGVLHFPEALLVLPFALLSGVLYASFGMIFTAICPTIDTFNLPIFCLAYPMFLFSGTFFPTDVLPGWARALAHILPVTHTANFARSVCLGQVSAALWGEVLYTAAVGAVLYVVALVLMRRRLVK